MSKGVAAAIFILNYANTVYPIFLMPDHFIVSINSVAKTGYGTTDIGQAAKAKSCALPAGFQLGVVFAPPKAVIYTKRFCRVASRVL